MLAAHPLLPGVGRSSILADGDHDIEKRCRRHPGTGGFEAALSGGHGWPGADASWDSFLHKPAQSTKIGSGSAAESESASGEWSFWPGLRG